MPASNKELWRARSYRSPVKPRLTVRTVLTFSFLVLLSYFCLQFFILRWESLQVSNRLENLSLPWIAAAMLLMASYYVLGLLIWIIILRNLGSEPGLRMIGRAYVCSLLPKYIPGNIAAHGIRTQLAAKAGVPVGVSLKSFLLEAVFAVGTAAVISIPSAILYFRGSMDHFHNWLIVGFALLFTGLIGARCYTHRNPEKHKFNTTSVTYVNLVLMYLLVWLFSGVAHWCLANALGSYSLSHLPQLTVAVAASWALGFVSIFTPAGLGVREAVLYFFVTSWMEETDIIIFVTLSRLLMFGVEVLLTLGVVLYSKISIRRVT